MSIRTYILDLSNWKEMYRLWQRSISKVQKFCSPILKINLLCSILKIGRKIIIRLHLRNFSSVSITMEPVLFPSDKSIIMQHWHSTKLLLSSSLWEKTVSISEKFLNSLETFSRRILHLWKFQIINHTLLQQEVNPRPR